MSMRLEPKPQQSAAILVVVFLVLLVGLLQWVFFSHQLESATTGLAAPAQAELVRTGVTNPVTAVLLNFRALDTLLELAVLLAALLGIWSLGAATPGYQRAGPVYAGMVAWVVPLLIITAGYLLWIGAKAPGGAFQAGALLAAAGVILRLGGAASAGLPSVSAQRWLAVAGIAVFALVGLGTMLAGRDFLNYPPAWSGWLILAIEVFATLTIATLLAAAYVGSEDDPYDKKR
ncbi:MnhB domain-containing protein [Thiorhodovibrio frisius]|uniref:MnhB-like protein, subunit of Na+/H+ antiporter n=1 Tax=Thiorhodovibrio frisius TaxID=631362 RepID=H8Z239_9GAMM|nr:MnhB domain-containing protein [Thiorhodovibrio frisius]EIC21564.1 MnhB-like protein, subunit of Na+/H+ antiporter [Thiorhodovibrio frisius]WPL24148.1 putative monovalent cation/H+ antiporter subunit B [Thiorhodovibrio frisius]